jgi:polyhydroxybutyrate depolymerase
MIRLRKFRILALLLTCHLHLAGCVGIGNRGSPDLHLGPGDYDFSLQHDGLTRKYLVYAPPSYHPAIPNPVVLALHGGGGNAEGSVDYFQLTEKSDQEGFIVVYPEGTGRRVLGKLFGSWNAGRCCAPGMDENVDDVGFLSSLMDKLTTDFNVDPNRIYVLGMSNGAQMAFRLACELANEIAAIGTSGSIGSYDECNPSRPVPVIHIQGREDPCSLYDGGECGGCVAELLNKLGIPAKARFWTCQPVPEYLLLWSQFNNCSDQVQVTYRNRNASCITYQDCHENTEVTLCTVEAMGHTWPGRSTYGAPSCSTNPQGYICEVWKETVGALSVDIDGNGVMWDFFEKHPLPEAEP